MNLLLIALTVGSLWVTDSLEEFRKGSFKNVSLRSTPELQLAPELTKLADTKEMLVLALAADARGNLYAGTGSQGRVLHILPGGSKELFASPEQQVLALAVDARDNLYAGTGPDGVIYRIAGGKCDTFFATGQKYIWALVFGPDGALYAGTGDSGIIYRITGKGKGKGQVIYDSPEPHITALAWQDDLYAGSSGSGLVYRLHDRRAQVLYKTARHEVKSIVVEPGGNVYAAANPDPEASSSDQPLVYRIRPDGNALAIFTAPDSVLYSLALRGRHLLAGTGGRARLYDINIDTTSNDWLGAALITESEEGQFTTMLSTTPQSTIRNPQSAIIVGTGNSGKVHRVEGSHAREGSFESRAFDTEATSSWGRCFWTGTTPIGTGITISTRSGSSDEPDDTWSPWEALRGELIASPPARYLQYRVSLATADPQVTPTLERLTIAYAQTNLAPALKSVSVRASDEAARHQDRVITWEADDPNDDSLAVSIAIRGESEQDWKPIETDKTGLSRYTLDTERLPDGRYQVRLVVSDRPGHPLGRELRAEKTSASFLVDNTAPKVDEISIARIAGAKYRLAFVIKDGLSLIARCELSTNLKDWRPVAPESGIFDARSEKFAVELDLVSGENVIVIRAVDAGGNTGTGKKVVLAE